MQISAETLGYFFNSANARFNEQLAAAPSNYAKISMKVPSTGAEELYGWASDFPEMREWIGDRVVSEFRSYGYVVRNRTFEKTIAVNREDFEDDKYGIYAFRFAALGRSVGNFPDELIFGMLSRGTISPCYDRQPFFSTTHPIGAYATNGRTYSNLQLPSGGDVAGPAWYLMDTSQPLKPMVWQERRPFVLTARNSLSDPEVFDRNRFVYGVDGRCNAGYGLPQLAIASTAPLTPAYYAAARASMMSQCSDTGRLLGLTPTVLMCGPELEATARSLLLSEINNATSNPWKGSAELVVTQYLGSPNLASLEALAAG